eukprot:TRINITY_DN5322_c0_g1_i1.p2 TRINITY_DN5322_c0_g1~~TRINITY_DN5322_c0_g1_i1.p2  ORF type:complete len:245 (-),score=-42.59 TRINITY_DN5322_c0_g1_i1:1151-1885(-)
MNVRKFPKRARPQMGVNDPQHRRAAFTGSDRALSLSKNFCALPVAVFGMEATTTTVLGTMKPGSLCLQNRTISDCHFSESAPPDTTTNAHGVSPQCGSGRATTAASTTAGCEYSTDSTSTLLIFSPPEMMISFDRSLISIYPSGCRTATSPVRNHPPVKARAVASGLCRYPIISVGPRSITSPGDLPSLGTLRMVSGSFTSSSVRQSPRTPWRALMRARLDAGSWFQESCHVQQTTRPAVSVRP